MLFLHCLSVSFLSASGEHRARRDHFLTHSDTKCKEAIEGRHHRFDSRVHEIRSAKRENCSGKRAIESGDRKGHSAVQDIHSRFRFDLAPEDLGPSIASRSDLQRTRSRRPRRGPEVIAIEEPSHPKIVSEPIVESLDI